MERIIGQNAPLTEEQKAILQQRFEDDPFQTEVQHLVDYFGVSHQIAKSWLTTPEREHLKGIIGVVLARSFYQVLLPTGISVCNPYNYTLAEAQHVIELYNGFKEIQNYGSYELYELSSQNPFRNITSMKYLTRTTGLSAGEIQNSIGKAFHFGELQLNASIYTPDDASIPKKAIRESVHYRSGAGILEHQNIGSNAVRIKNGRRMISVEPQIATYIF